MSCSWMRHSLIACLHPEVNDMGSCEHSEKPNIMRSSKLQEKCILSKGNRITSAVWSLSIMETGISSGYTATPQSLTLQM